MNSVNQPIGIILEENFWNLEKKYNCYINFSNDGKI